MKPTTALRAAIFAAALLMLPSAWAADPCCGVVSVDTRTGIVTAQDKTTQRRFEFKLDNAVLLRRIKPGQGVDADLRAGKVTLEGIAGQYAIVGAPATGAPAAPVPPPVSQPQQPPAAPAIGAAPFVQQPQRPAAGVIGAAPPAAQQPQPAPAGVIGAAPPPVQPLTRPPTAPAIGAAPPPMQQPQRPPVGPAVGAATCPLAHPSWKFHPASAARPAILLFHGNANRGSAWTMPSTAMPDIPGVPRGSFDFRHMPDTRRIGETHAAPNAGFYKVGHSDSLEIDDKNWWHFLVQQNFTVATWDQNPNPDKRGFAEAYASTKDAFKKFVCETKNLNPVPPIALVGHSRGGLLIRKLLKENPPLAGVERVRWVVTLHSPHHGSDMARAYAEVGAEVVDLMDAKIPASMPGPFGNIPITGPIKAELKKVAVELLRPLDKLWMADNHRELMTDGPLVRDLAQGEAALAGVKYYTFGGDTPSYFKLYVWVFDPNSAVPQYKVQTQGINTKAKQYFVWRVKAVELPAISPLLDKVRNFTPEITPGKGDGFVSDKSARLPFSIHETTHLNHMEVLWDKPLQLKVLGILTAH